MKISEENFILHIKLKNEEALRYAIQQYEGLVKSVVRKHLNPDAQRMFFEECVSDVFLGVWDNIESYEEEKNTIKNWIAAIARYKAIDYSRKYAVIRFRESEEMFDSSIAATALFNPADDGISEQMQMFMNSLGEGDRELFRRIYIEEDSVADISRDTGMKRDVIYNRLSRARKKIKKLYPYNERRENNG